MTKESKKTKLPEVIQQQFERLLPYEKTFVYNYVQKGDKYEAVKASRKIHNLSKPKKIIAIAEAEKILMKKEVKDAVKEYRTMYNEQTALAISKAGLDLVKLFTKLATEDDELKRLNERIEKYDELIEDALSKNNDAGFLALSQAQMTFIKQKDNILASMRKNVSLWNDTSGIGKSKQIIKAGNININMGNQTIEKNGKTKKDLKTVEAEIKESNVEDLIDIDEV